VSPLLRSLQDSVTILTLGSVEKYKNPDLWLKTAIAYLQVNPGRDVKFLWAGGGSLLESMRNKVPDEYKKQVHFAGSIDNPELFFQKATLYFQPSKVESFGLAVAEALSFGVPCVVSDSGGLPEVISPTCSKTVHGSNPKEFVKAISSILNDKALYLEMSQNAVRHHSEKLSIEGWEERLSKVIGV
jgi:glycosyltransferase involved in cell wall biosynthesis